MSSILDIAKHMSIRHNVTFNVYDEITGKLIQHHEGHNAPTNSILTGIAHYLTGDGVLNQGYDMLSNWIPKYISLGTMGLTSQDSDSAGLPIGIGGSYPATTEEEEIANFNDYLSKCPGYGADGYDANENNHRIYYGLGPTFDDRPYNGAHLEIFYGTGSQTTFNVLYTIKQDPTKRYITVTVNGEDMTSHISAVSGHSVTLDYAPAAYALINITYQTSETFMYKTVDCELTSSAFPRIPISYRSIVPEAEAELPRTIDVVFSAMVSTGALKEFRESGKDYIFITEAGLWSNRSWPLDDDGYPDYSSGSNGLLAGYRIGPVDESMQDMTNPENREALKSQIIRAGYNQVVQIIWKIQLGSINEFQVHTE